MKKRYLVLLFLAGLAMAYILGPRPQFPTIDANINSLEIPLQQLDEHIAKKEQAIANIKPENNARIIWADSIRKTPYSIVYLHGFSVGPMEADPIHFEIAEHFGCNLYLARLAQHGIDDRETFADLTPKDLVDAAKEAIAIGKLIGEKTIVMSCSTGGTLSAYLAAHNPDMIDIQVMYSPNFEIAIPFAGMLTMPWAEQIAYRLNGKYRELGLPEECYAYWTKEYRVEGLMALQGLLDATMTDDVFSKITQPTFLGFYYKNEMEKDQTISIPAIHNFYDKIKTPSDKKVKMAFPDAGAHVFVSKLQSKDLETPRRETIDFLTQNGLTGKE